MVRNFRVPLLQLLESGDIDLCFANEDEATELLRWLSFSFMITGESPLSWIFNFRNCCSNCSCWLLIFFFFLSIYFSRGEQNADPEAALEYLSKHCRYAVVTLGPKGCIAKHGQEVGQFFFAYTMLLFFFYTLERDTAI